MSRELLILRHAKSSWDSDARTDFERPLAPRGLLDAPRVGAFLARQGLKPDFVVSSPAERARETVEYNAVQAYEGLALARSYEQVMIGAVASAEGHVKQARSMVEAAIGRPHPHLLSQWARGAGLSLPLAPP